ncbi:anti-sigma regulatory factor [Pseudokineococcus basanitobsidens]|uniref:Anti-sigma regulatory factor n=1 Tax=Pseudokineococcus basanitobsidens TaxID=1926649 RepID=A0ABU8RMA1_9ACTN
MARAEHGAGHLRGLAPSVDLAPAASTGRTVAATGPATEADEVVLRLPADPAYLSVLRTTAAALGARLDLTLEEVEDVRIAVDEAAALVLGSPPIGQTGVLEAVFEASPRRLAVLVHGPAGSLPGRGEVAWAVLEALAGDVRAVEVPHGSAVRLVHELGGAAP